MIVLLKNILKRIILFPLKIRNRVVERKLETLNEEQKFSLIYKAKYWTSFKFGSLSGSGSNLYATENIRRELPNVLSKYKIKSMLDLPCGDFFWMRKLNLVGIDYIGGDIVPEIVSKNQSTFGKNYRFIKINLLEDNLPQVDLVFTRDCLVHLTNEQVMEAIKNVIKANPKYFMTTVFEDIEDNISKKDGDRWRKINLTLEPFNLPIPLEVIDDSFNNGQDMFKRMYLWEVSSIAEKMMQNG
jgi:hypothetical protein